MISSWTQTTEKNRRRTEDDEQKSNVFSVVFLNRAVITLERDFSLKLSL